jgi:hypothetical protein
MAVTPFDSVTTPFDSATTPFDGGAIVIVVVTPPPPPPLPAPTFVIVDQDTLAAIRELWDNAGEVTPVPIVDQDTLAAVQMLWETATLGGAGPGGIGGFTTVQLPGLVTLGFPIAGRAKSQPGAAMKLPYVKVSSKPSSRRLAGSNFNSVWFDFREVTFTVYALKQDVANVAGAVLAVFNRQLGEPGQPTLNYPSGARFMGWQQEGEAVMAPDPTTVHGDDVWTATITAKVQSLRAV